MKKSVIKKLLGVIICLIMVGSLAVISSAKIIILDAWLPFETWTGSGTASVTLGDNFMTGNIQEYVKAEDFEELIPRHNTPAVTSDDYTVSTVDGVTVITLEEEYLKTLEDNAYYFFAEFKGAQIPVVLYVVTEKVTVNTVIDFRDWKWEEDGWPGAILYAYDQSVYFSAGLLESVSYKGEKLDPLVFSASNFSGAVRIGIDKEYLRTLPSGTHYFEAEFMNVKGIMLKIDIPPVYTLGDYSGDGKVTAEDARAVLRISAKIDGADSSKIFIADIDADGKLTASDARRILRVSAKLESFNVVTVELEKGEVYETPVMTGNGMYMWFFDTVGITCESSSNIPNIDPLVAGTSAQKFTFSANESGVYNVRFKKMISWDDKSSPIEEIFYIVTVK